MTKPNIIALVGAGGKTSLIRHLAGEAISGGQKVLVVTTTHMDMSEAVNIFLRQCILRGGLPFNVEMPHYNKETLDAMAEAKKISRDPDVEGYTSMKKLKKALEKD